MKILFSMHFFFNLNMLFYHSVVSLFHIIRYMKTSTGFFSFFWFNEMIRPKRPKGHAPNVIQRNINICS